MLGEFSNTYFCPKQIPIFSIYKYRNSDTNYLELQFYIIRFFMTNHHYLELFIFD